MFYIAGLEVGCGHSALFYAPRVNCGDQCHYFSFVKETYWLFCSHPRIYCVYRLILRLFHEAISDYCASIAVRNSFSPVRERECSQT